MRSEYYNYDSRWNRPLQQILTTVDYAGESCSSTSGSEDCEECFEIKYTGSEADVLAQLPWGFCAYFTEGSVVKACPTGINPESCGYTGISLIGCNPDSDDPDAEGGTLAVSQEEALDRGLYLRSVITQIDTVVATPQVDHYSNWNNKRTDSNNDYVIDFYLTDTYDDLSRREAAMLFPFDTLSVRTIDERNRYTQVQLEHNVSDIYTKYYFQNTERVWHRNTNAGEGCYGLGNYSSIISENIGLPTQVTVGYGRLDSLATQYVYYPNYALDSMINPNGQVAHYTYDDYDRLAETYQNDRLLSSNYYEYWKRDNTLSFQERTAQNFVGTYLYNGPVTTSGPLASSEHVRAYVDPLGRNYSTLTTINNDSLQVHSGTVGYDNWGRVNKAFKPYKVIDQTSLAPLADSSLAYVHSLYENTPKSRALRTAKYGITDIMDAHTVKQSYKLIDQAVLACELNLIAPEAALIINPDFSSDLKFIRTETEDEDDKKLVSYANAIGQQVATKQFGASETDALVTLFVYDNYGNLTTTINPEKARLGLINAGFKWVGRVGRPDSLLLFV